MHHARAQARANADLTGTPTAGVAKVTREDLYKEVTIPAEFRPYEEVELHAKVSGYVKRNERGFRRPGQGRPAFGHARSAGIAG